MFSSIYWLCVFVCVCGTGDQGLSCARESFCPELYPQPCNSLIFYGEIKSQAGSAFFKDFTYSALGQDSPAER
jgi:hypothetical protein